MLSNPILQMLQNGNQNPQSNIMMQAVGAMLRGETPQSFLQNLAKTYPELQGRDMSDPNRLAETLYQEKGQDINAAKSSVMEKISAFIKH